MLGQNLQASPGDNILRKYRDLTRWLDAQRFISLDDRITVNATPSGQHVTLTDAPPSIVTPLQVRFSGKDFFSVGEGYVNGRLPVILTASGEEVPLVDEDGVPHAPARLPTTRPILVVAEVIFKPTLELENILITTKRPDEIVRAGSADFSLDGKATGHVPLAYVRGARPIQFTLHNLQVRAYRQGLLTRVLYWPA